MDESLKRADLSYLPDEVAVAAREFVTHKYRIDIAGRSSPENISHDLHGFSAGGEFGPHFGLSFFCNIIPFLPSDWEPQQEEELLVPTSHTFGCSWRWWPDRYCDKEDERKIKRHIFSRFGLESTSYTFIPQFGLYCPSEGKNRVNFCRYHKIEHIPARVFTHDYPEAERISLYVLNVAGGIDVWAVLDGRYAQKISHYNYALPLLRAYGVTIYGKWPAHYPSISKLLDNELSCREDLAFHNNVIDMKAVNDVLARNLSDRLDRDLFEKTNILYSSLIEMSWFVLLATLICMVTLIVFNFSEDGAIREFTFSLAIFIFGAISMSIALVFLIKRKLKQML
ncbi:hypothetical protein RHD99_08380 [Buttiauxella selenatireducens]|uniref:Uncharacterized protein n=1 Tax=Buttiauxella selenatireducens TaxID=3073902 RepID=A0ABY9SG54_9ENTR|nr:hypothetical protein [Buttiauxella sp. R73]WMY75938.1 hypothetical protein RHD99_08380 [Buttiauxella sp. R73]